jgi:hypothetical protein
MKGEIDVVKAIELANKLDDYQARDIWYEDMVSDKDGRSLARQVNNAQRAMRHAAAFLRDLATKDAPASGVRTGDIVRPTNLRIGLRVRTLIDYSGVPQGTAGEIVAASNSWPDTESVAVHWRRHPGDTLCDWFDFSELYTLEIVI